MTEQSLPSLQSSGDSLHTATARKHVQKVKVVTVGDDYVGKTCVTMRFVKDKFDDRSQITVGANILEKTVKTSDKTVICQVWDTAGQEQFHSLIPMYLRDARAAIVVYDVTDPASFESIKVNWLQMLLKYGPENMRIAIVGNKVDLVEKVAVSSREALEFAQDQNCMFKEISAKTGQNVEELFYDVVRLSG